MTYICTYSEYKGLLVQCVSVSIHADLEDPKMGTFWGPSIPLLERVFNKTRSLAQSLHARARVGIVRWGMIAKIDPQNGPHGYPLSHR